MYETTVVNKSLNKVLQPQVEYGYKCNYVLLFSSPRYEQDYVITEQPYVSPRKYC